MFIDKINAEHWWSQASDKTLSKEKNSMKTLKKTLLVFATVGSLAFGTFAATGAAQHHGSPDKMVNRMKEKLGLSDAQRDQVKAIAGSHKDEWKALADRGRAAHEAVNAAVTADTVDDNMIRQKSADASAVEADMAVERAHARAEVLQILTADQEAQLKTMQAQMQKRMGGQNAGRRRGAQLLERLGL